MPFDQFTIAQLAGDMLPDPTIDQLIATGFHRNSIQALGNNPRKEEFRVKGIVDRVETTGQVWLGMSVGCAECHDHKYDPISTEEYYQLFAIFNNVPHEGEKFEVHGPRLEVNVNGETVAAQVMAELAEPRETRVHIRGNFEDKGKLVQPGIPKFVSRRGEPSVTNRLEFARWLVDERHPLTARVIVNRIWQHYFGRGLVSTPDDFGSRGERPTHPELLDWLAVEFVASGWSVKHIHRLILNSATFQQSSAASDKLLADDPANLWLARFARRRASAEVIRDSILAISGQLDRRIGGRSIFPHQPDGVGVYRDKTAGEWKQDPAPDSLRRGIYVFWQRMSPYPSLTLFDATSRERCTVKRSVTNTPLQALVLLNDPVYIDAAKSLSRRVLDRVERDQVASRLGWLFHLALTRKPTSEETSDFRAFRQQLQATETDEADVWFHIAMVMLNLDETISIE